MCYKEFKNFFNSIYEFSIDGNLEIYLVGGFLRDWFINNEFCSNDVDFAVKGDAKNLVNKFIKEYGGKVTEFKSFLTSKISDIPSLNIINQIDFAGLRKEVYEKDGAFPKVESTEDILEDLKRRDYSINTLAIKLKDFLKSFNDDTKNLDKGLLGKFIINSQKGLEDLENRVLRVLHFRSFYDDPTRILRGYRYKYKINGDFDNDTKELLKDARDKKLLNNISKSRILKEIEKIRNEQNAELILQDFESFFGAVI